MQPMKEGPMTGGSGAPRTPLGLYSEVTSPVTGPMEDDSAVDPTREDEGGRGMGGDHADETASFQNLGDRPSTDVQGYRLAEQMTAAGRESDSEF